MILPKRLMDFLRSRRFRIALACSPFVAIVLLALGWAGINWYGRWKFDRTVDELVAWGFPRTMKEAIGPVPADEENLLLLPIVSEERLNYRLYCEKREISPGSWGSAMGILNVGLHTINHPEQDERPQYPAWAQLEKFEGLEGNAKAKELLATLEFASEKRRALMDAMSRFRPGIADQAQRSSNGDEALEFLVDVMISLDSHGIVSLAAGQKNEAREDFLTALRFARNNQSTALSCFFTERTSDLVPDCVREPLMKPPAGIWNDADLQEFDAVLKDAFTGELTPRFQRMHLSLLFDFAEQAHRHPPQRIDWKKWSGAWEWKWETSLASLKEAWRATRPQGLRDLEWAGSLRELSDLVGDPHVPADWQKRPQDLDKIAETAETISYEVNGDDPREGLSTGFQNWGEGSEVEAMMWSAMARCSIALDRHQLRHGTYPYSLEDLDADLKKDLPSDPLSKAPFIYRKTPKGGFKLEGTEIAQGDACIWERNLPE